MQTNNQIIKRDQQALILLTQTNLVDLLPQLVKDEHGTIDEEIAMITVKKQVALTVSTAFDSDTRIYNLLRKGERTKVFQSLNSLLFLLNATINVKDKLNTFQAVLISNMIMEDFVTFTIDEVSKAFINYASGDYGPTYNRIDIEGVRGALYKYENSPERLHYIAYGRFKKEPEIKIEKGWYKVRKNRPTMQMKLNQLVRELNQPLPKKTTKPAIVHRIGDLEMSQRMVNVFPALTLTELHQSYNDYKKNGNELCLNQIKNEIKRRYGRKTNTE